jgi:hypothetical protein
MDKTARMPKIVRICLVLSIIPIITCSTVFSADKEPKPSFLSRFIPEINGIKVETAKNADSLMKANVTIGEQMKSLADVKASVGNIEAKLNVQGSAIAGFKNTVSNLSSGRDTVQTTTQTNSDAVVTTMLNTYKAIIVLLITQMVILVKFTSVMYNKVIERMQKEMTRILESKDKKENKIDEFQEMMISKLSFGEKVVETILEEAEKDVKEGVK